MNKLPFEVLTKAPVKDQDYDFCFYDYPPNIEKKIEGKIVVVPYQPSALDIGATSKYLPALKERGLKVVEVINMVKVNRAEPKAYALEQCKKGAYQINDRSIYQRVTNQGMTIFSPEFNGKYGIKEARNEMNKILEAIL